MLIVVGVLMVAFLSLMVSMIVTGVVVIVIGVVVMLSSTCGRGGRF